MKKLMIALAAAATTVFAFGAGTAEGSNRDTLANDFGGWTGTSFEALTEGSVNVGDIVGKDDTGNQDGENKFWYSAATETDELGTITNEVAGAGVSRPDAFAKQNQANTKSLQIDTTSPLFRTALPNSSGVQPVDIGDGIYLDTLVKFTAADEVFGTNALEAVDKIAIEYVEREADETAGITALTNFVVRAGFIGSELFTTNYAVELPAGWIENNKKDDWHRLTVRALLNIDGQNRVGFKIYLDENVLKYVTDNDEFAQSSGIDDATHTIFPSAVETDKNNYSDISSVAFSGSGFIDDVVFTTEKPDFIKNSEAVVVPFVADAGVTAISVSVAGVADPILVDMTADTLSAQLPAQTAAFTVTATVNTADGYEFVSIKVGDTSYDVNPASVTGYAGESITITTARNNFNLFDADGNAITTGAPFQKLSEVLETEGVAKIVLAHDYDVAESEGAGYGAYDISSDITLDLNGNTITGGGDDELFTVGNGVTMIVIDSSAANTGKINYIGTYAVFYSEGDVVIGALTGDYGPSIDGYLAAAEDEGDGILLVKGKIEAATNSGEGAFLWNGYLGNSEGTITSDADLDSDEKYWVVTPQGGSTTFALTTTGGANATVTTNPADVSALTEETEVTITATAAQDYTYDGVDLAGDWTYDSQADAISMTTNISENTTVVVPNAVSEQSSEDWPEGQALIDAEGQAAGDLFSGITNALATADAKAVATWAEANKVAYADKGSILPEAFLLNCANTQAAIDEAAANFKITAITVAGDTVTITPADGADYGNGKVVIEGTATLSPISWHEKTDGDHFFRATLVVKPVAAP